MQVGDYQILRELGAGGMGKVFQVRNVISDRIEAMKVLLPDLVGDPGLMDRFLREIKVQAALDHPNIAGLRTAMRDGNQLLMIMEFVEGHTISEHMQNGPIPAEHAIRACMEVLAALDYAHSRGIVHRDIKPSNILVNSDGRIKQSHSLPFKHCMMMPAYEGVDAVRNKIKNYASSISFSVSRMFSMRLKKADAICAFSFALKVKSTTAHRE